MTKTDKVRAALEAAKHDIMGALATTTHLTMAEIENYPAYKKVQEALSELDGMVLVPVEPTEQQIQDAWYGPNCAEDLYTAAQEEWLFEMYAAYIAPYVKGGTG